MCATAGAQWICGVGVEILSRVVDRRLRHGAGSIGYGRHPHFLWRFVLASSHEVHHLYGTATSLEGLPIEVALAQRTEEAVIFPRMSVHSLADERECVLSSLGDTMAVHSRYEIAGDATFPLA